MLQRGVKPLACMLDRALGHDHDRGRQTKVVVSSGGKTNTKAAVSRAGQTTNGAERESHNKHFLMSQQGAEGRVLE